MSGMVAMPDNRSTIQATRHTHRGPVDCGERVVDEMGHAGVRFTDDETLTC
jgi:hypothetical protein